MSLTRFIFPGLALGLILSVVPSVAKATPVSTVMLSNLGSSGTSSSVTVSGTTYTPETPTGIVNGIAQGFRTGATGLNPANSILLSSVNVILGNPGTNLAVSAKLYSDNSGLPNTSGGPLQTSTFRNVVGASPAVYSFDFLNYSLSTNTTYWVVFDQPVQWFQMQDANNMSPLTPTAPNPAASNAFVWAGSKFRNTSGNWVPNNTQNYVNGIGGAFAVTAVPEPSTYAMAGIGAGLVGLAKFRRRLGRSETQG